LEANKYMLQESTMETRLYSQSYKLSRRAYSEMKFDFLAQPIKVSAVLDHRVMMLHDQLP
jgi:hypothetical protein